MQHQIINVDSKFCETNPKGIFTYKFDKKISNVCSVRVSSFEFPNIYYTFTRSRDNLSFYLLCDNNKISVNIREGSYTGEQLLLEINNIFQKNNTKYGFQFKITYDDVTSKCTISNGTVKFSAFFENESIYDCLGKHLGFLNNCYDSILDSTGQRLIMGESILNTIKKLNLEYLDTIEIHNSLDLTYINDLLDFHTMIKILNIYNCPNLKNTSLIEKHGTVINKK